MSNPLKSLFLSAVAALFFAAPGTLPAADEPMIYELRTYYCNPGKLPALHARFRDHTMKLFEKHGMKNIAYWTPADQEETLVYIIAHKSDAAAKASWAAFISDPEWKKAQAESEKDGKLVMKIEKQFLKPTDYSPVK
ncbi:MAG TPA: NIPSNAP family protein [Planctomycetaceae bacterium]|nr:NIPSNAP family protein [Planctomycetaceae bacterium]